MSACTQLQDDGDETDSEAWHGWSSAEFEETVARVLLEEDEAVRARRSFACCHAARPVTPLTVPCFHAGYRASL